MHADELLVERYLKLEQDYKELKEQFDKAKGDSDRLHAITDLLHKSKAINKPLEEGLTGGRINRVQVFIQFNRFDYEKEGLDKKLGLTFDELVEIANKNSGGIYDRIK